MLDSHHRMAAPTRCSTPMTFCAWKKRSARAPATIGAKMAPQFMRAVGRAHLQPVEADLEQVGAHGNEPGTPQRELQEHHDGQPQPDVRIHASFPRWLCASVLVMLGSLTGIRGRTTWPTGGSFSRSRRRPSALQHSHPRARHRPQPRAPLVPHLAGGVVAAHARCSPSKMTNLDFPVVARKDFGIDVVEYVNQFFMDKAEDKAYLAELKKRCDDNGVKSGLIMCDREGALGDAGSGSAHQGRREPLQVGDGGEVPGLPFDPRQRAVLGHLRRAAGLRRPMACGGCPSSARSTAST